MKVPARRYPVCHLGRAALLDRVLRPVCHAAPLAGTDCSLERDTPLLGTAPALFHAPIEADDYMSIITRRMTFGNRSPLVLNGVWL